MLIISAILSPKEERKAGNCGLCACSFWFLVVPKVQRVVGEKILVSVLVLCFGVSYASIMRIR